MSGADSGGDGTRRLLDDMNSLLRGLGSSRDTEASRHPAVIARRQRHIQFFGDNYNQGPVADTTGAPPAGTTAEDVQHSTARFRQLSMEGSESTRRATTQGHGGRGTTQGSEDRVMREASTALGEVPESSGPEDSLDDHERQILDHRLGIRRGEPTGEEYEPVSDIASEGDGDGAEHASDSGADNGTGPDIVSGDAMDVDSYDLPVATRAAHTSKPSTRAGTLRGYLVRRDRRMAHLDLTSGDQLHDNVWRFTYSLMTPDVFDEAKSVLQRGIETSGRSDLPKSVTRLGYLEKRLMGTTDIGSDDEDDGDDEDDHEDSSVQDGPTADNTSSLASTEELAAAFQATLARPSQWASSAEFKKRVWLVLLFKRLGKSMNIDMAERNLRWARLTQVLDDLDISKTRLTRYKKHGRRLYAACGGHIGLVVFLSRHTKSDKGDYMGTASVASLEAMASFVLATDPYAKVKCRLGKAIIDSILNNQELPEFATKIMEVDSWSFLDSDEIRENITRIMGPGSDAECGCALV